MIPFPQIAIRQTYGRIGIDADLGTLEQKQPRPHYEMKTTRPEFDMHLPRGDLAIDQSKAWDALGLGNNLETMHRIYSEAKNIALQGIARRVENGNRLAAIHLGGNPIVNIVQEEAFAFHEFNYLGPASFDNVDIFYTARKAEVEVRPGTVQLDTHPVAPELAYHRGKVDIHMLQYNRAEIIPPVIDMTV